MAMNQNNANIVELVSPIEEEYKSGAPTFNGVLASMRGPYVD